MEVKNYYFPKNLSEARKFLRKKELVQPIAGGTSFFLSKNKRIDSFVDLSRLGLNYIRENKNSIVIGAGATFSEISKYDFVSIYGKLFKDISSIVATCQIRNIVTIGGNIIHVYKWSDMPVLLLACNAKMNMYGNKRYSIDADKFFSKHPKTILKKDDLLIEITIPIKKNIGLACERFVKTKTDFIILSVATNIKIKRDLISDARIVIGGGTLLPQRMTQSEQYIVGKIINNDTIKECANLVLKDLKISKDIRVSTEYKQELAIILTERALARALGI